MIRRAHSASLIVSLFILIWFNLLIKFRRQLLKFNPLRTVYEFRNVKGTRNVVVYGCFMYEGNKILRYDIGCSHLHYVAVTVWRQRNVTWNFVMHGKNCFFPRLLNLTLHPPIAASIAAAWLRKFQLMHCRVPTPHYYGIFFSYIERLNPRGKFQTFDWHYLSHTDIGDLQTLVEVRQRLGFKFILI